MTLAFALRGSNGLVLGADSRVSGQFGTSDTSTKFLQVNREIGILTYGLADVGYTAIQGLVDEVNNFGQFGKSSKIVHFSTISEKAEQICKQLFEKKVEIIKKDKKDLDPNDGRLLTGFILAGYDANETNQFKIMNLQSPEFKPIEQKQIIAAQWHISHYLSDHFYYSEMSVEQLKKLAVFMLIETETVSPTVGGQLKIATVTLEGGFQQISEDEIQRTISENQFRFSKYRRVLMSNLRRT